MTPAQKPDLHLVPPPQQKKPPESRPLIVVPGYDMFNKPAPETKWLVEGLIPKGSIFCLNGRGGIWKSWTFTSLALCVATGAKFMNHFRCPIDEPRNAVLFVQLEENRDVAGKKYRWIVQGLRMKPEEIQDCLVEYIVGQPFRVDDPKRMDQMKIVIDELRPDMVLWDNVRRMKTGNTNDSSFAADLVYSLNELQEVYPSAHGLIHHWRKKSSEKGMNDPSEMGSGNAALRDACDVWLPVERDEMGNFATMKCDKMRDGKELRPFNYTCRISDRDGLADLEYIGASDGDPATGCALAIQELIATKVPGSVWAQPDIARELKPNWTPDQVRYGVDALERAKVVTVDRSKGGKPTLLALRSGLAEQLPTRPTGETGDNPGNSVPGYPTPFKNDD